MFTERITIICDDQEIDDSPQKSIITDAQLRALNRKHLLMIIRDLEKDLAREKEEKANLLMVCQSLYESK